MLKERSRLYTVRSLIGKRHPKYFNSIFQFLDALWVQFLNYTGNNITMSMNVLENLKERSKESKNLEELLEIPQDRGEELNMAIIDFFKKNISFKNIYDRAFSLCENDKEAIFVLSIIYYHHGLISGTKLTLEKEKKRKMLKRNVEKERLKKNSEN